MKKMIISSLIMALLLLTACEKDDSPLTAETAIDYSTISTISYRQHVQPLLDQNCISCHGAGMQDAGLRLDSWDNVQAGSNSGEVVIPFDAGNSVLIEMLTKLNGGPHPGEAGSATMDSIRTAFLTRWVDEGAKNDDGEIAHSNCSEYAYVCSQDADLVSAICVEHLVVTRTLKLADLGFAPGMRPHHLAVSADGNSVFLSLISGGKVLKLDRDFNLLAESESISIPALLALNHDGSTLYVSRFMDFNQPFTSIIALNTSDLSWATGTDNGAIDVLFEIPHSIAIDRGGDFVYTASLSQSRLMQVNTSGNELAANLVLGTGVGPLQIAASPVADLLAVSGQVANQMQLIDVSDPANPVISATIAVNAKPWHPVFSADGSKLYVGNLGANTVSVIDIASATVSATIAGDGLSRPHGIALSAQQPYLFISSQNVNGGYTARHDFGDNANIGTVVVINTESNQVIRTIEIEQFGSGMAIR
jgi:YVTN family beta-propeller protein